ncbi:hypothetical protein HF838_18605 [Aneurinibacillus aneurinilyticus]|uniref:Uncharacterized protein n=1 Tax=Aneurinibacillus aneurinilyticus TaxID=1391 RepID=A0A848CZ96_ANEAE|nr:hypothetical protein [Aneurinibacillus aneurinilyticus]
MELFSFAKVSATTARRLSDCAILLICSFKAEPVFNSTVSPRLFLIFLNINLIPLWQ